MTFSKVRFFGLLILFMAQSIGAFSSETFKEAWVLSYCRSADTFEEMRGLFAQGDVTAARMHYRVKVVAGECTDYTRYGFVVSFKGERIAARYESPAQGKTIVIEGRIVNADNSNGEKAFVWVAAAHIANFLESLDGKPVFQPIAPEFKGWQDT